jgi:hypothetical protein
MRDRFSFHLPRHDHAHDQDTEHHTYEETNEESEPECHGASEALDYFLAPFRASVHFMQMSLENEVESSATKTTNLVPSMLRVIASMGRPATRFISP